MLSRPWLKVQFEHPLQGPGSSRLAKGRLEWDVFKIHVLMSAF